MVEFVIYSCVVWRLTSLVVAEAGPLNVFEYIRNIAAKSPQVGILMQCQYCASVWISFAVSCVLFTEWKQRILWALALSGAALLLDRATDRKMQLLAD